MTAAIDDAVVEGPTAREDDEREQRQAEEVADTATATEQQAVELAKQTDALAQVRGRNTAERKTPASKVPLEKRIADNPNHSLTISLGKLYCVACKFSPFNKCSSIQTHLNSPQHQANLLAWNARQDDDSQLKRPSCSPTLRRTEEVPCAAACQCVARGATGNS